MINLQTNSWLEFLVDSPVVEQLGWCLVHSTWQIALISFVVLVGLFIAGRKRPGARHNIAILGLLLAVAAPIATWFMMETPNRLVDYTTSGVFHPMPVEELGLETMAIGEQASYLQPFSWRQFTVAFVGPWLPVLTIAWLVGVLTFSLRPLLGLYSISRLKRTAHRKHNNKLSNVLERLMTSMQIQRSVRIVESSVARIPMVVGFVKPLILIPSSVLTNLSGAELQAVIAHELAHLRRYDDVVNLIQTFIETVLFFHPCVWWLSSVAREERENCCDDWAVHVCGERKSLATALLTLEQARNFQPALASNGGSLVKRIRRLKETKVKTQKQRFRISPWLCLTTILLVLVSLAGIAWSAQQKALAERAQAEREEIVAMEQLVLAKLQESVEFDLNDHVQASQKGQNLKRLLETRKVQGHYRGTLAEAMNTLSSQTGVNITLDERALRLGKIGPNHPIDIAISQPISFRKALDQLLQSTELGFATERGLPAEAGRFI